MEPHDNSDNETPQLGDIHTFAQLAAALRRTDDYMRALTEMVIGTEDLDMQQIEQAIATLAPHMEPTTAAMAAAVLRDDFSLRPGEKVMFQAVNCAERMHVCHAICCRFMIPLSQAEVDAAVLDWDTSRPYYLAKQENGFCVYNNRSTGACGCYEDRPLPCRRYTCADDERIWTDFDNMILNTEWLEAAFGPFAASHLDAS